jgi:hypothetical protein
LRIEATLSKFHAFSAGRKGRGVERVSSEISDLQALAADHVCRPEVEAISQKPKADATALLSEAIKIDRFAVYCLQFVSANSGIE